MEQPFYDRETYTQRRKKLANNVGSGTILLLGNSQVGINFKDNWFPFRQDSSFLYYFGISQLGPVGIIDIDEGKEYLVGNELTIDQVVWTGSLPTLAELVEKIGITNTLPLAKLKQMLENNPVHFLPPYRSDHILDLENILGKTKQESRIRGFPQLNQGDCSPACSQIQRRSCGNAQTCEYHLCHALDSYAGYATRHERI